MSLESMTGFGRGEEFDENFRVVVEIKSVNHRYKDFRFRTPSIFNSQEVKFKKLISEAFKRGSFDISINFKRVESEQGINDIDEQKVTNFINKIKAIPALSEFSLNIKPTDFLRNEFLKDMDESEQVLAGLVVTSFNKAIAELKLSRLEEGKKLKQVLQKHRENYANYFQFIEEKAHTFQSTIEEKLRKRVTEFKKDLAVDEPRLLQEVIFYLEKLDIHEEINRIRSHLDKLDKLIQAEEEVGRQLDFLVQELNRETNTIGSKANMVEITDNVVKMKVELEKIREQGLNLQ